MNWISNCLSINRKRFVNFFHLFLHCSFVKHFSNFFDEKKTVPALQQEKNNLKTNQFTARIKSSKNMETSKVFIGEKLLAHKNKFQNFKKNTFFYSDLEGCNVIDLNKKSIGRVSRIFNFGAGDILEITKFEDNSTILISFNKTNFPKVSINKREITSKVSI